MTRPGILFLLLLLVVCTGCASNPHPLIGTWKMVEAQGETVEKDNIKIVTSTHFAFLRPDSRNGVYAGGGRVEFKDETYRELIQYHSRQEFIGSFIDFTYRIEDDLWYHEAEFDMDGRHFNIFEIWQRLGD